MPPPSSVQVDIRTMIHRLTLRDTVEVPAIDLELHSQEGKGGKIREIIPLLTSRPERVQILRRETLVRVDDELRPLSDVWERFAYVAEPAPAASVEAIEATPT